MSARSRFSMSPRQSVRLSILASINSEAGASAVLISGAYWAVAAVAMIALPAPGVSSP